MQCTSMIDSNSLDQAVVFGVPVHRSFEGGTLVRNHAGLHLFTTDTSHGLNTSLVYYHALPGKEFNYVRQLACCSSANADGRDQRASLWAPMPSWDARSNVWRLFYVQYKSAPSNASGWYWNYHGQIVAAVSTVAGFGAGIGGPYDDEQVVLTPGSDSQSWEGLQGTDSLSPPYLLPDNKTWAAFYGSAQTEHATARPHNMSWYNGLVTTSRLGDPFVRRTPSSLVNFNQGFSENPIVSYLASRKAYIAVFDALDAEANGFGVSWSSDGMNWDTPAALVAVPGGARTPLAALPEDDGKTLSVFYTAYVNVPVPGSPGKTAVKERVFHGTFTLETPELLFVGGAETAYSR